MPDIVESAVTPGAPVFEPLPDASPGEIVGLLEYLDARGGSDELFHIVTDTTKDFGRVITVVKAAEMLDFVDTPKRLVTLAADGHRYLKAPPAERKAIWREQLLKLQLFRELNDAIIRDPGREIDREVVLEMLALRLPWEDPERVFRILTSWAWRGGLFEFDEHRERLIQS